MSFIRFLFLFFLSFWPLDFCRIQKLFGSDSEFDVLTSLIVHHHSIYLYHIFYYLAQIFCFFMSNIVIKTEFAFCNGKILLLSNAIGFFTISFSTEIVLIFLQLVNDVISLDIAGKFKLHLILQ